MEQPVTWDQLIEAAEDQDTPVARPGHPGRGADGVDQRAHRVRRRARSSRRLPDNPEDIELGLDTEAGEAGRRGDERARRRGRRRPGVLHRRRGRVSVTASRSGDAAFMVNWPFVWAGAPGRGRGRHAGPVGARRLRLGDLPGVVEDEPSAPPYGGINLGIGAFSENADARLRGRGVHRLRGEPGLLLHQQRQPGGQGVGLRRPRGHRGLPAWRRSSGSRWRWPRRGRRPPYYSEVSGGAAARRTTRRPRSTRRRTPQGADDLISAVLRRRRQLL